MADRFVPVPYKALAEANTPKLRLVVLGLYERAHAYGWVAVRMTVRDLADLGGARLEDVMVLLDGMEARGLIVREKGRRGVAGSITVLDPSKSEQRPPPKMEQRDDGPPAITDEEWNSETPPVWNSVEDTGARGEPSEPLQRGVGERNACATPTVEPSSLAPTVGSIDETLVLARCREAQERASKGKARWTNADVNQIRGALETEGIEGIDRLREYFDVSNEFQPRQLRSNPPTWRWTTLLNAQRQQRFDLANDWHERNKVDRLERATGPPRARGQPKQGGHQDELAEALRIMAGTNAK